MNDRNYDVVQFDRGLAKMWTRGVLVEDHAVAQIKNIANMPFVDGWVAVMPDTHAGMGATIGSVIPTRDAVIPAAVGVDIGCGMNAIRTDVHIDELPEREREKLYSEITRTIPHGRTDNGGPRDKGAWGNLPDDVEAAWMGLEGGWKRLLEMDRKVAGKHTNVENHIGTLGTGNHFIEASVDPDGFIWTVVHSGSRGVGARIGGHYTKVAQDLMKRFYIDLADANLAYLPKGTDEYDCYMHGVMWAQRYAVESRAIMSNRVIKALRTVVGRRVERLEEIECIHNYVAKERHYGKDILVTRKGACRAQAGDRVIIPGSMGDSTYICTGLGNRESYNSCSHGAGRTMSRTEAQKRISLKEHKERTDGVVCRKDAGILDESPSAYKNIEDVMVAQQDLVQIDVRIKALVNVKG